MVFMYDKASCLSTAHTLTYSNMSDESRSEHLPHWRKWVITIGRTRLKLPKGPLTKHFWAKREVRHSKSKFISLCGLLGALKSH